MKNATLPPKADGAFRPRIGPGGAFGIVVLRQAKISDRKNDNCLVLFFGRFPSDLAEEETSKKKGRVLRRLTDDDKQGDTSGNPEDAANLTKMFPTNPIEPKNFSNPDQEMGTELEAPSVPFGIPTTWKIPIVTKIP